jgi:hypothetical protein
MDSSLAGGLLGAIGSGLSGYQTQSQKNKELRMKAFADFLERERQKRETEELAKYRGTMTAESQRHNMAMESGQTQGNLNDIFMKLSQPPKPEKEPTPPNESQVKGRMLMELAKNPALANNPAFKWALGPKEKAGEGRATKPRPTYNKIEEPPEENPYRFQNLPPGWGVTKEGSAPAQPQGGGQEQEIINSIGQYLSQNPNVEIDWDAIRRDNPNLDIQIIRRAVGK